MAPGRASRILLLALVGHGRELAFIVERDLRLLDRLAPRTGLIIAHIGRFGPGLRIVLDGDQLARFFEIGFSAALRFARLAPQLAGALAHAGIDIG